MTRHAYLGSLLCLASCLGANDRALFDGSPVATSSAGSSAGGSSAALAGTDSGASQATGASAGTTSSPTGGDGSGEPMAGSAGSAGSNGGAPASDVPKVLDCAMVEGATVAESGHCYRVNDAELTFAEARDACAQAGGHLLTVGNETENALGAELHDGEHWIGANDGRADTMPGVGEYTWVSGETFDYSDWEDEQPNAFETNCADGGDETDCFEHGAFQSDEGDWNDRSCWHTIVSICEWDIEPAAPGDGAAGARP